MVGSPTESKARDRISMLAENFQGLKIGSGPNDYSFVRSTSSDKFARPRSCDCKNGPGVMVI